MPTTTWRLYRKWADHMRITNDSHGARLLKLTRQTPSGWKQKGKNATADVIARMCADLGENPIEWILRIEAEKAHETTNAGRTLMGMAKKVGTLALILACATGVTLATRSDKIHDKDPIEQITTPEIDYPDVAKIKQRNFERRTTDPHPNRSEDGSPHASPWENG